VCLTVSSQASALLMSDVGELDKLLDSTTLTASGDSVEEAWVESVLGFDVSLTDKYDSVSSDWEKVTDAADDDVYAAYFGDSDPEYYFLKLGTGGLSGFDSHYLFENLGDLSYAAIDFLDAGIDLSIRKVNLGRISHVGEIDGGSTPVSEPASIALFGLGLLGLAAVRRKMAK
jgi:hypothetical protein